MASYPRKYATGTGSDIYINIPKAASANHAASGDWTPATGDVKVSLDGGAAANIGTLPTAIAMGNSTIWKFVFTDAELTAKFVSVTVSDSATKAVDDTGFSIETYGHASAQMVFDLSTATQSVTVATGGLTAASIASGAIDRDAFAADTGLQSIRSGTAQAGGVSTITLDASASAVNDYYYSASILTTGGTGAGQFRIITDYVGATKVATVDEAWATNPDNTTTFAIFPATSTAADIADAVWDEAQAGHATAGTFGAYLDAAVSAVSTSGLTAADIADAVWDEGLGGHTTSGTSGERLGRIPNVAAGAANGLLIAGTNAATVFTGSLTATFTGNLTGSVASVSGAVGSVTGNVGGNVTGSVGSLASQAKQDVNAEVLDVLTVDAFAEPVAVPPATSSLKDKIGWLFTLGRNKFMQTATEQTVRNDADGATIATAQVSDDSVTYIRGEWS